MKASWETQGQELSLRGRRCEQMRERGTLPNLSAAAADVACWARTVIQRYSGPLRNSGSTAGWEVWVGRLTSYRAEGSVHRVTGQWGVHDGCVFKWFRKTCSVERVVRQMRVVKLDDFFSCLSMGMCARQEWKEQFCLSLKIHSHAFRLQPVLWVQTGLVACVNNDQRQYTLTHNLVTEQKRQKKEIWKRGKTWRWLRKLGWKRTEIAFGAVWLRL